MSREDGSLKKDVNAIAAEVVKNDDLAIWLLNRRAQILMRKSLSLNDGHMEEAMKAAATNFCALPNIANWIGTIRKGGANSELLLRDVTRLSILGHVKYTCSEWGVGDKKKQLSGILENLGAEMIKNKPSTSSRMGELGKRYHVLTMCDSMSNRRLQILTHYLCSPQNV